MKTSHPPIVRMIVIDRQIRQNRYPNCTSIAREFEVNTKTIQRDIDCMRYEMDAPIAFDPRKNGYYYTEKDYFLPAVHIKESELLSFLVTEKILKQYQNTPYYAHVKNAVEKILQFLPGEIPLQEVSQLYDFQTAPTSPIEQHKYDLLEKAVRNHLQIKMKYHSLHSNEIKSRLVDPYYILNKSGFWYFVGKCYLRSEILIFALNRILQIDLTDDEFDFPEDFDKEKYLADSFQIIREGTKQHVCLKFSPYQARWIRERQWHRTQKLTDLPDGSLRFEMDVTGLSEIKRWVLQYGAEVEVLAPEILRTEIKQEIEKMGRKYNL